jgi:hypothetical protein
MPENWNDLTATLIDNCDGILERQVIEEMNVRLVR